MKGRVMAILIVGVILAAATQVFAKKITENFEKGKLEDKWEIEGETQILGDKKHGGQKSLKISANSKATFSFSDENKLAKVVIWVYDEGITLNPGKPKETVIGGRWGVINVDGECFVHEIVWHKGLDGNEGYGWFVSTDPYDNSWSGVKRIKEWSKWEFDLFSDEDRHVIVNDSKESKIEWGKVYKGGITGVYFQVKSEKSGPLYVDDIEIDTK